jgi:hypothetical protein
MSVRARFRVRKKANAAVNGSTLRQRLTHLESQSIKFFNDLSITIFRHGDRTADILVVSIGSRVKSIAYLRRLTAFDDEQVECYRLNFAVRISIVR